MNILAVDYGTKRMGLAWTDTSLGVILPFGIIEKASLKEKVKDFLKILDEEKVDKIVVGFPLGLNGKENVNTERVKKFVFEVQKTSQIPVEYQDERFSSFGADSVGDGVTRDERAAMFILEGFINKKKKR